MTTGAATLAAPRILVVLVLALAGCRQTSIADVDPAPPSGPLPARTYAIGWAPTPPRPEIEAFFAVVDSLSRVSEITILQQPVPWPELFAGAPIDSLAEDRGAVADFLRARGLDIIFLVDPLDGLNRRAEDPGLTEAGRSILEPEIRTIHEDWVRRIAERIRPEYLGLASEINTLAALGDPGLYAELLDLINTLAPQIREISPATKVFVSFQADEANGHLVESPIDEYALIDDFDIDALGLSSYPVFVFDEPADVPIDYFDRFDAETDLPLIMVEGGWNSEPTQWAPSTSPEQQAGFFRRYADLLDRVSAEAWVMLTFADLDIASLGLPPDRAEGLSNFAFMGIVDTNLGRKPAYSDWELIHLRPLAP